MRGGATADGTQIQIYTCNGTAAQTWTVTPDSTLKALGKCLDVSGGGTADGTKIQLWTCNGSGAQNWTAAVRRDPAQPESGKCLDVTGDNSADSTVVHLWTCHQRGQPEVDPAQADGTLKNPQTGKCLDVSGNTPADGQAVHLWTCHTGANQKWTLPPARHPLTSGGSTRGTLSS